MKKYFPHISSFILTLVFISAVSGLFSPTRIQAQATGQCWRLSPPAPMSTNLDKTRCLALNTPRAIVVEWRPGPTVLASPEAQQQVAPVKKDVNNPGFWMTYVIQPAAAWVVGMILKIVSLLTGLSAVVLNGVIYYTIVQVSENYTKITGINEAWKVIRDLANMTFIFILLYAAIQTILGIGEDTKKLIVRVIVVAILINFSLFFTKIIIDVSNVLALLFYDAIAPGALNATGGFNLTQAGLSNAFMQHLSLTSLYKVGELGVTNIITIGVIGSIMLLIAAFVFFAVALMFIIRYVVLILVIILSPFAFMGWILPAFKKWWDQWWDALSGQAFFAPIYFMLTWIALRVFGSIMTSFGASPGDTNAALSGLAISGDQSNLNPGTFAMLINFIVVIVFLIASLLIAKTWANKAGPAVTGLTKWAMGAAGGATLGMAGRVGRGTLGRMGAAMGESEGLKERAAKGGAGGMAARLALATGRKTAGASFDVRGGALGGTLQAGQAQKGGFAEFRKKQAEAAEKRAKSYGPSEVMLDQAKQEVKKHAEGTLERVVALERLNQLEGFSKKEAPERIREILAIDPIIRRKEQVERDLKNKQKQVVDTLPSELRARKEQELETIKRVLEATTNAARTRTTEIENKYKEGIKGAAQERKEAYAKVMENSYWAKARGYNKAAAAQIRKVKSKKDKFTEAAKEFAREDEGEGEKETEKQETLPTEEAPPPGGPTQSS